MSELERFEYPESADAIFVPSWNEWGAPDPVPAPPDTRGDRAQLEQLLTAEKLRSFESGRARGHEEGRAEERSRNAAGNSAAEERRTRQVAELLANFEQQRAKYFETAEQQVVRLALAVAARILRREAQTDPLLLIGAVRIALGQVAASTEVQLIVPQSDLELWSEAIALIPNLQSRPHVRAAEKMQPGECVIETSLGKAEVGIRSQLSEIERVLLPVHDPGGR